MADTERTKTELLSIFADGQPEGSVDPQDMRDFVVTSDVVNTRFSSGLIIGGVMTINGGDNTKIDISAGTGFYADNFTDPLNPVRIKVSWTDFVAQDVPLILSMPLTSFALELSSGSAVVITKTDQFTASERRDFVTLGVAVHTGMTVIDSIISMYRYALDERQLLEDMFSAIGSVNIRGGNVYSGNSNLTIKKTAGSTFDIGVNYDDSIPARKSPNISIDPILNPVSFFYNYQDGSGGFTITAPLTDIDPEQFDDGSGTLASVQANRFTIKPIWFIPKTNVTVVHYGQVEYSTLAGAQSALNTQVFVSNPGLETTSFRGWLIVKKGVTDLTAAVAAGDALFIVAGRFGDISR